MTTMPARGPNASATASDGDWHARLVSAAAAAEGARQRMISVTATMEGQANLALELYDVVEVTEPLLGWSGRAFRVRRIAEEWEKGRLTQTVYLGDE